MSKCSTRFPVSFCIDQTWTVDVSIQTHCPSRLLLVCRYFISMVFIIHARNTKRNIVEGQGLLETNKPRSKDNEADYMWHTVVFHSLVDFLKITKVRRLTTLTQNVWLRGLFGPVKGYTPKIQQIKHYYSHDVLTIIAWLIAAFCLQPFNAGRLTLDWTAKE